MVSNDRVQIRLRPGHTWAFEDQLYYFYYESGLHYEKHMGEKPRLHC